ncbi:hypothetical protein TSOC_001790 [Tetrabaena socialis]|uniref:Uncharacterized protein n=1 Tax=Tetrabaena socialis TaxID=47790 RepID=A0A2J8AFZ1_9CHLO|nr:hypothetical protein TSOC_001790 [Tetrabaena socialis]|eukprot:PNH11430.1 hypothetical protein TSOC_001790 [Tetrabaena socialis]
MATLSSMRIGAAPRVAVARTQRASTVKVVAKGSWRDAPTVTAQPGRAASSAKPTSPTRSVLPANWRQELESLRGGNGNGAAAAPAAAAPRAQSAGWRDAPASAPAASAPMKKTATPARTALPANWKQELESLRSSSTGGASAAPAAAPARASSASWRDAPAAAPASKSSSPAPAGTNPWTGKSKIEIKRTALPADWRKGL